FRVFESVIPSGDHDNHLKEFSKNPNKGYYKHALYETISSGNPRRFPMIFRKILPNQD
ncbi:MAG: hypothetical protein PWQ92_1504, partial [Thermococcaceae archaeon]|nr:hypothetical protein [Thermococcaceae archaeon]